MLVNVQFQDQLSFSEIVDKVSALSSPHILLWYIGTYGLKKECADFYRKNIISPILRKQQKAIFWLVDLTAWGSFKNPLINLNKSSTFARIIEKFQIQNIRCISASNTFKKMQALNGESLTYFKKALQRQFIRSSSQNYHSANVNLKTLFKGNCPVISEWYQTDAAKGYSTLQYLEGCLLIDEIIERSKISNEKEIHILFVLPNDENKYYQDETHAFKQDLLYYLNHRYPKQSQLSLNINFLAFKYGCFEHERPYNIPGKVFKKKELSCKDIVGDEIELIRKGDK